MALQKITVEVQFPTVDEILVVSIYKYITLDEKNCGYSGKEEQLLFNYVHDLFLKTKAEYSKEENPSWHEATTGPFSEEIGK